MQAQTNFQGPPARPPKPSKSKNTRRRSTYNTLQVLFLAYQQALAWQVKNPKLKRSEDWPGVDVKALAETSGLKVEDVTQKLDDLCGANLVALRPQVNKYVFPKERKTDTLYGLMESFGYLEPLFHEGNRKCWTALLVLALLRDPSNLGRRFAYDDDFETYTRLAETTVREAVYLIDAGFDVVQPDGSVQRIQWTINWQGSGFRLPKEAIITDGSQDLGALVDQAVSKQEVVRETVDKVEGEVQTSMLLSPDEVQGILKERARKESQRKIREHFDLLHGQVKELRGVLTQQQALTASAEAEWNRCKSNETSTRAKLDHAAQQMEAASSQLAALEG